MVLTDNLGGRLHSLSSQYAGFRDFDEPVRVVTPMSACPPDNGETSITPFRSTEQQQVDTSRNETLWPGREQVLGEEGRVEIAPFRSLSLGSYAWASYPQFEDIDTDIAGSGSGTRAVLEIDPATDLRGKVINPYGAMIILQTKYETTLKSLGLFDSEDEDKLVEDTDILFSRWGFHNGQPSCAPTGLVNTIEKSRETSNVLGSNPGNKQQGRRWRILSANARKLPGTFTGKGQCMPWSWRQIRSWGRRRKRYDSVLGGLCMESLVCF